MERRLAAIFAADMANYSRLMEADEVGTLTRQKSHRVELIDPMIGRHGGRIIKLTGDGMIAEFPSVVEAVRCAVSIQREMQAREADTPEDRKIRYRVAVNLGDVIFDDGDVYGDGVNIAARLEALADPGGVVVSGTAYDHLKSNIDVGYVDLGEQRVKNIATPVRVYRVVPDGAPVLGPASARRRPTRLHAAIAAGLVVVAVAAWRFAGDWGQEVAAPETAGAANALLDGPSIAVLPFDNLGGDPTEDYLADGIAEDIITDLSKLRGLAVIARNSTFAYKGKAVDVRQVGRELGVRSVLEGSVRKVGDRLRINVQLIDAATGDHIWADRYDVPFAEVFEAQDRILEKIVTELDVSLAEGEQARVWRRSTNNAEAYALFLRAREIEIQETSEEAWHRGGRLLDQALALDPKFTAALVARGWTWFTLSYYDTPGEPLERAMEHVTRALEIDDGYGEAYALLAELLYLQGDADRAMEASEKSVELAPSNAKVLAFRSFFLADFGRTDEAVEMIERAIRLDPNPPAWYHNARGYAYFYNGEFENAVEGYRDCIAGTPDNIDCHINLVAAYLELDQVDDARAAAKEVLRLNPEYSISKLSYWIRSAQDETERQRRTDQLLRAGLPP